MVDTIDSDRRTVLKGTAGLGVTLALAGCSSIPIIGDDDDDGGSGTDLSYGDTIQGRIEADGPRDPIYDDLATPHRFSGSQGDRIRIDMDSDPVDTYLVLVDSSGGLVAENDDRAFGNLNSTIETTLPADDTYTIWAGSWNGEETGPYTLSLQRI